MDEFDKKREVVQMLMDMLRKSSVGEMDSLHSPKEASIEKISVSPESSDALHPDAAIHADSLPMAEEMKDDEDVPAMSDGGSIEEQDIDNNSSTPFEALMNRKKKMK